MRTPEGGAEALEDRDLPALQRLRTLVAAYGIDQPEVLDALAEQLASEPLLAAERADLLRRRADRTAEPTELLGRLRDLADALEGTGVTVAAQIAERLEITDWARGTEPRRTEAPTEAAGALTRDGGTASGLLAVALVTGAGSGLQWPEEWRSLLSLLRRHPDADVRHAAYQVMTERE
jgi:hypothetical protein